MSFNPRCLREVLENTPLSIDVLAENSGVSRSSIVKYLKGDYEPGTECLVKIADYLALPLDILYGRCTEEEYNNIMKDYSKTFMELRKAPYESYILSKQWNPELLIDPYQDLKNLKYESPWPYNLIDQIYAETVEYKLDPDHERGIDKAISCLKEREQKIVHLYFEDGLTLDKIAKQFGLTRERIRQILAKSIRKLRNPHFFQYIKYGEYGSDVEFDLRVAKMRLNQLDQDIDFKRSELSELTAAVYDAEDDLVKTLRAAGKSFAEFSGTLSKDNRSIWHINNLELSVRSHNCLLRAGCETVQDIVKLFNDGKARYIRNFGRKSCEEVLHKLSELFDIHMTMEEVWV